MKYEDFISNLTELEKLPYMLTYTSGGKVDNARFEECFELAEAISNSSCVDAKLLVKHLNIVPAKYADISLSICAKINPEKLNLVKQIKDELVQVYLQNYKKATKTTNKLVVYSNANIQLYSKCEKRLVDEIEIIKLAKALKVNPNDVIGEYKGGDLETKNLSEARMKLRKKPTSSKFEELLELTLIKNLNKASDTIKELENKISI